MGSYYALEFNRETVFSDKGLPPPELMTLFRPCDRAYPEFPSGFEDDDSPYIPSHAYQVPVPRLVERLEIMGFTLAAVEQDLKQCVRAEVLGFDERIEYNSDPYTSSPMPGYLRDLKRKRRLFEKFTLRRWSGAIRKLRQMGMLHSYQIPQGYTGLTPFERYILNTEREWEWHHFGFPTSDLRYLMRALLVCARDDENVLLDLSELEAGGYLAEDSQPVSDALEETIRLGRVCEKILILTEGRSDTRILERSLEVLYPHLADMYSFLDHEAFQLGGGTGNLANLVKGIAGVGLGNRVIAVFDNDAAGALQAAEVRALNLPANFRILNLPQIKIAKRYPTLGPNGALCTDINGSACSLEVYLGKAALTQDDGSLAPVQWKGFEPKLKRYQGEILAKNHVQKRFLDSLNDPSGLDESELGSIRGVLRMIFTAFA